MCCNAVACMSICEMDFSVDKHASVGFDGDVVQMYKSSIVGGFGGDDLLDN